MKLSKLEIGIIIATIFCAISLFIVPEHIEKSPKPIEVESKTVEEDGTIQLSIGPRIQPNQIVVSCDYPNAEIYTWVTDDVYFRENGIRFVDLESNEIINVINVACQIVEYDQ